MSDKTIGVIVSPHARDRLLERFPDLQTRDPVGLVYSEVMQALEQGRKAKNKPRWAATAHRDHGHHGTRYAWNLSETRAYVIGKLKGDAKCRIDERGGKSFDETWIVRTVLPRNHESEALLAHVHRYRHESRIEQRRRKGRNGQSHKQRKGAS